MPFKPELYPDNWKEISTAIRARAGNKCQFCGVENGAIGYRSTKGQFVKVFNSIEDVDLQADAMHLDGVKLIRIILTVAHLDHIPSNCTSDNLRALCQRCHLNYDAQYHAHNSAQTRRRKKIEAGQMELRDLTIRVTE
jgi:hypothetical protein